MKNGTWLIALLFSVACEPAPPAGDTCTRTSDCASPLTCQLGRCRTTCRSARDCPLGARCLAGESGGVCSLEMEAHCAPCAAPLQCGNDQCRTQCLRDSDCWAGTCEGTTCLEPISGEDAGVMHRDGGTDAGAPDAATPNDAGSDAASDAFVDDGSVDAFVDDGGADASSDVGTDAQGDVGVDAP